MQTSLFGQQPEHNRRDCRAPAWMCPKPDQAGCCLPVETNWTILMCVHCRTDSSRVNANVVPPESYVLYSLFPRLLPVPSFVNRDAVGARFERICVNLV